MGENSEMFKDPKLKQAIRIKLNKYTDDILKSDVEKIVSLSVCYTQIENIDGIENLTNLKELLLSGNQIANINSLEKLTNLERLALDNNKINDISALKGLVNL
ncbi:leucine-rich repeat domain-containing protein, partial [Clostridium botulinum]